MVSETSPERAAPSKFSPAEHLDFAILRLPADVTARAALVELAGQYPYLYLARLV